jgi:hypothetical protein
METMSSPAAEPADLLDLKFLPAWVKEPAEERKYDYVESEDARGRDRQHPRGKRATFKAGKKGLSRQEKVRRETLRERGRQPVSRAEDQRKLAAVPPEITVRFLPYSPALDSVVAQIKSTSVAYSLFALARLFLEKPERYQVRLIAKAESPLYRLGENGAVSLDRDFLERDAFRFAQEDFYRIEITQSEPIKGNFSNVARCRLSGTLLGPTNYHSYQPRLRSLYEQRFSRRMSFTDYQRNIEIVSDPELLERWKEEARKSHHIHDLARRIASNISVHGGSRTALSLELFAGIAHQCGRSDHRGRLEPAFARSKAESRDRGSLDARDPLAIEYDPRVSGAIATSGGQCFSASTRHVVRLDDPDAAICPRSSRSFSIGECDSRGARSQAGNQSQRARRKINCGSFGRRDRIKEARPRLRPALADQRRSRD